MSKGSDRRAMILCRKAYELAKQGYTNRQIAEALGLKVEQVPGKVMRGQRYVQNTTKTL